MDVIPQQLCQLADTCRTAAQSVNDGWSSAQGGLVIGGTAAGNTSGAADVLTAATAAADAAGTALGRLAGVLEQDMDALQLCAFDFSATDEAAARDLEATGLLMPFPFGA